ncbi:HMG box transcription factor BBX [Chrysoperla carnea]|uniref:HMG box transcription factor BBX n=1 Tax=Chrysoperla carnea TaxID=189513 RepID=UPI001D07E904|nr:HMG box transcription factor BBX [Chrysoperla carnea]
METEDNVNKHMNNVTTTKMAEIHHTSNEHILKNIQQMKLLNENYTQQQHQRILTPQERKHEMHDFKNNNISITFQAYQTKDTTKCPYDDDFENTGAPTETNNNNEVNYDDKMEDEDKMEDDDQNKSSVIDESESQSDNLSETNVQQNLQSLEPSHHARRPMNAFLIFCKRHRAVVREKYPTLENRGVTKILGEWWAGLEEDDKACYTALAKQYKDAFFNANPDFKWYKLPAPPLRTLNTRPGNYSRPNSSMGFDYGYENHSESEHSYLNMSDFTPGKLADETQLGNLSSLIDPNYNSINNENMNEPQRDRFDGDPSPPKPIRKRYVNEIDSTSSESPVVQNSSPFTNLRNHALTSTQTLEDRKLKRLHKIKTSSRHDKKHLWADDDVPNSTESMTQQELIDRIVEHSMRNSDDSDYILEKIPKNNLDLIRKSGRSCKGKRYAEFMTEGRLVVNKRSKKSKMMFSSQMRSPSYLIKNKSPGDLEEDDHSHYHHQLSYNVNLNCTIQKLSDRTANKNITEEQQHTDDESPRQRTHSGASDDSITKKMFRAADFNLDEKIEALPSLSLEKFQQKKKENKKRKKISHTPKTQFIHNNNNNKIATTNNNKMEANNNTHSTVTGSRKRKARKESITHVVATSPPPPTTTTQTVHTTTPDLFNLATLAEVAVKLGGNPP